jgi:accessory gene regulator B
MVKRIATTLLNFCLKSNGVEITNEQREVHQYGLEVFVFAIVNIISIIIAGLILQNVLAAVIFFFLFSPLRVFCGGYHAKNYLTCNTFFILLFVSVFFVSKLVSPHLSVEIISMFLIPALLPVYAYAPVVNPNKNAYGESAKKKYNRVSVVIFVVIALATLFLAVISTALATISALALFTVSIFVLTERFKKGGLEQ